MIETDAFIKVDLYNQLAMEYSNVDSINTAKFAQKAIELAKEIRYPEAEIDAIFHIAWVNTKRRSYQKALELFNDVLERSSSIKYEKGEANGLLGLSVSNFDIGKYKAALDYAERALMISLKIDYKYGIALSYNQMGIIYVQRGESSKALEYFAQASLVEEETGDIVQIDLYNRKGVAYAVQGDLNRALNAFFKSVQIEEQMENVLGLTGSYNNIGVLFYQMKNYDKAVEYYRQALGLFREIDDISGIATVLNNIGVTYEEIGAYDSAKVYFENAIEVAEPIDFMRLLGWSYDGLSKVHQAFGQLDQGEEFAVKAIEVRSKLGRNINLAQSYNTIGNNFLLQKNYSDALSNFELSSTLCEEIGSALHHKDALLGISKCYEALEQYEKAHSNHVRYKAIDDSLRNKENIQKMTRLEAEFQFQKERDSISFLQEREALAFQLKIDQKNGEQRILYISLSLILLLLLVTLYLFYVSLRANKKLNLLNDEINHQNIEIKNQRDSLKKLNGAKTRFFSIISHDLRSPIANLIGYSELIKNQMTQLTSGKGNEELEVMYGHMQGASKRILNLLDGLLKWALKEEGMIPYQPEKLKLKELVKTSFSTHSLYAISKDIKLEEALKDETQVWADKNSLLTIIRNLIGNALKFTGKGGTVKVYSTDHEDVNWVNIHIQDTGIGISKENITKLFKLEENVIVEGTSGELGTGLGLNMVSDFIKLNGAQIKVESTEGEGSTFIISIPCEAPLT